MSSVAWYTGDVHRGQAISVPFSASKDRGRLSSPSEKDREVFAKGYIAPSAGCIRSLISYFAAPKGLEDWRIVFDTGANKLNEVVDKSTTVISQPISIHVGRHYQHFS